MCDVKWRGVMTTGEHCLNRHEEQQAYYLVRGGCFPDGGGSVTYSRRQSTGELAEPISLRPVATTSQAIGLGCGCTRSAVFVRLVFPGFSRLLRVSGRICRIDHFTFPKVCGVET